MSHPTLKRRIAGVDHVVLSNFDVLVIDDDTRTDAFDAPIDFDALVSFHTIDPDLCERDRARLAWQQRREHESPIA